MIALVWILTRVVFLTMMQFLGVPMNFKTAIALLVGYSVVHLLVRIANFAAIRIFWDPARLQGPLNVVMLMDIATLVAAMGGIIITIRSVAVNIMQMNA